jgi:uncharacterized membrane protein YwzB
MVALIFFAIQSGRHIKFGVKNKGSTQVDLLSIGIILCFGISFFGFFIYKGFYIGLSFAETVTIGTEDYYEV